MLGSTLACGFIVCSTHGEAAAVTLGSAQREGWMRVAGEREGGTGDVSSDRDLKACDNRLKLL